MNKKDSLEKAYKFKDLKVYASTEWLSSGKKYRRVFENMETTYLYAELSFYNKLFDEEDWKTQITIKCFLKGKSEQHKEICNIQETIDVSMEKNEVFFRQGWGADETGSFWKRGNYFWEAWIDNEMVGTADFHVVDEGLVDSEINPYFNLQNMRVFEGGWNYVEEKDRVYLKHFSKADTRYVWIEVNIENIAKNPYYCEIILYFYDKARQLKGSTAMLNYVDAEEGEVLSFATGWGNNNSGETYIQSLYYVEVVFMENLLGTIPLRFEEEKEEGDVDFFMPGLKQGNAISNTANKTENLESLFSDLNQLIGLTSVKKQIKEHIDYIKFLNIRKEKGFEDSEKIGLHSVFTGNPGTGKTTVVNMLGRIYKSMGLLSKGHVIEVGRAELVAEYIGQTAPKVKKKISEARGGILFIDEAYALFRKDDDKDFGREVIEIIIKEMSDGKGDIAIMFAGYPAEMQDFITSNPGLKSRINYSFHFDDYLPEELMKIIRLNTVKKKLTLSPVADKLMNEIIVEEYRNRDRTFGNARMAISLLDEAKMNMARRLMQNPNVRELSQEQLSIIELIDVQDILQKQEKKKLKLEIDEGLLNIAISDLNKMIGLGTIKTEVNELIKLVRYYNDLGKDVLNKFSLHTVFTGNPGTGKTTVARIIGQIYKALGLLERGNLIEVDRSELVAGYVGQTAIKTQSVINSALGGILFIDEAYSLTDTGGGDFGKEAVEVILKEMEDHRGEFALIVAGYPEPMNKFLLSNPGLKSRFDRVLVFDDYTADELLEIAASMFEKEGLFMNSEAKTHFAALISKILNSKDAYFGNAREIRKITQAVIRNQNLRLASTDSDLRTPQMIASIIKDDFRDIELPSGTQTHTPIGFKKSEPKQ